MAQTEIAGHPWPAEVEIPIGHPRIFIVRIGINREGQIICAIQNVQVTWNDFDVSRRKLWIFRARHTRRDAATDFDHIFAPQCMRLLRKVGIFFRAKDYLCQTFAVAQIDEDDPAMVTRDMHPTGERDLLADLALAKRIAIVRAIHAMPTVSEWEIRASVYVWGAQVGSLAEKLPDHSAGCSNAWGSDRQAADRDRLAACAPQKLRELAQERFHTRDEIVS
jgi:hypothetical protein